MYTPISLRSLSIIMAAGLLVAGCTSAVPQAPQARVYFVTPATGAVVASPVRVTWGAETFIVEPAGEVKAGHGHLHIMVDTECVEVGHGIPKDETHLHYGQGQLEADLALAKGDHTLCLQAADGNHIALAGPGMTE
ncbi:MAG: DUF4399 domain-containing protein, partial [Caldilineaceae bacterium]|nr:DUF4399 domain-containing protein [Caldilineaceae bacterium]